MVSCLSLFEGAFVNYWGLFGFVSNLSFIRKYSTLKHMPPRAIPDVLKVPSFRGTSCAKFMVK